MALDLAGQAASLAVALAGLDWLEAPLRAPMGMLGLAHDLQNSLLILIFTAAIIVVALRTAGRLRVVLLAILVVLQAHVAASAIALFLAGRRPPPPPAEGQVSETESHGCERRLAAKLAIARAGGRIVVQAQGDGAARRLLLDPAGRSGLVVGGPNALAVGGIVISAGGPDGPPAVTAPAGLDGVLGGDVLTRFDVEIDLATQTATLWQMPGCAGIEGADLPRPDWASGGSGVPFTLGPGRGVQLPMQVNGAALSLQLDGGAGVRLRNAAAHRAGWDGAAASVRVGSVELGAFALSLLSLAVAQDETLPAAAEDGAIGLGAIGAQHVLISYAAQRLYLAP